VLNAIVMCRDNDSETEFDRLVAETFAQAGVKGWDELESNWRFIVIDRESDDRLHVTPMRRCASGGYVTEVDDPTSQDTVELGKTVIDIARSPELPTTHYPSDHV
jgi:hypothetical protein